MSKRKALGKGLSALIRTTENEYEEEDRNQNSILNLKLEDIVPNQYQPRKFFSEEKLNELVVSIKEKGIIQPIIVTKIKDDDKEGKYEIIAGERRYRAANLAGLENIPCIIKEITDYDKLELALIENIQREDLNPIEEANTMKELLENLEITQSELSQRIGKSRTAIANTMRLLRLPAEIKEEIIIGNISEGHGRALLGLKDETKIDEIKNLIIEEGLSVRETEKFVSELNNPVEENKTYEEGHQDIEGEENADEKKESGDKIEDEYDENGEVSLEDDFFLELEDRLNTIFDANVKIKHRGNKGSIVIKYSSKEELSRIINKIKE